MQTVIATKENFEERTQSAYDMDWKLMTSLSSIGAVLGLIIAIIGLFNGMFKHVDGASVPVGILGVTVLGFSAGFILSHIISSIITSVKYKVMLTPISFGPRSYDLAKDEK